MAAFRLVRSVNMQNLSPEEVLGRSLDPLGLSGDPLGEARRSYELLCTHVFQLLNLALERKVMNMWSNMRVQLSDKLVLENKVYVKFDDHCPAQQCRNHY